MRTRFCISILAGVLFGVATAIMRPAALILNLLVSVIGTVQFARAGHFRWRTFWPFAVTSNRTASAPVLLT